MSARSQVRGALLVAGVTVAASVALSLAGVPSAVLFGALLGGMAHALTSPVELQVPPAAYRLGQALIGVMIGVLVDSRTLGGIARDAVPITLVVAGTVTLSLLAGRVLALRRDVSTVTGAFAMVAGGASGVVAVARDLGADDRVVTVVQYLRVLLVLVSLPVVTALAFPGHRRDPGAGPAAEAPLWLDLAVVGLALVLGLLLARWVPVPTAVLLGPMLVAAVLTSVLSSGLGAPGGLAPGLVGADLGGTLATPAALQWVAYALVGVQVGLRFTRASLVSIARMLPVVLALTAVVVLGTAGMGAVLAATSDLDGLTAYLATTPGGLFAVLAIATDSDADVTWVSAVQVLRLVVIVALTPLLARWLARGRRG